MATTTFSNVSNIHFNMSPPHISAGNKISDEATNYNNLPNYHTGPTYVRELKVGLRRFIDSKYGNKPRYYGDVDIDYIHNICEAIGVFTNKSNTKYYGIKQSLCTLSFCELNNIPLIPPAKMAILLAGVGVYRKMVGDKVDIKTGKTIAHKIRFSSLVMKGYKIFDEFMDRCCISTWDIKGFMYTLSNDDARCIGDKLIKDLRYWYLALDPRTQDSNVKLIVDDIAQDRYFDNKKMRAYFHKILKGTNGQVFQSQEMEPFKVNAIENLKNLKYHS